MIIFKKPVESAYCSVAFQRVLRVSEI